ncbi:MAG: T9SS type A sorting domain-containing protein [Bacteroidota bacterium]
MNAKRLNIALLLMIGFFSIQASYAFGEHPKGSRLYIKPATKQKTLTFAKGKSVLAFKPLNGSFDLKPTKTVNLYFTNYLINRNLSKSIVKEQSSKNIPVVEAVVYNKPAASTKEEAEPGEKLFAVDGLYISNIYPNPADDAGYFDYSFSGNNFKEVKIEFFNVLGSPMNVNLFLDKFDRKTKVNLKEFPNGFYFYQLTGDGKTLATKKLLVRHFN